MNQWNRNRQPQQANTRLLQLIIGGIIFIIIIGIVSQSCSNNSQMLSTDTVSWSSSSEPSGTASSSGTTKLTVPWDYQVSRATVGDLIGGDMTVQPSSKLLPNDNNYATGDTIWVVEYMSAVMDSDSSGRTNVTMTSWVPVKSYKTEAEAQSDVTKLIQQVKSEVDLIGVYKTTYQGSTRYFAILELPSGNRIKQPIDEARYAELKSQKKANVLLEEVHSYLNYDLAYAKFRGWAS